MFRNSVQVKNKLLVPLSQGQAGHCVNIVNHVLHSQSLRKLDLLTDMCVDVIPFDWPIAVWTNSCALLCATTEIVFCSEKTLLWS
jgi:hypothetical protein